MSVPIETITIHDSLAENQFYWRERDGVRILVSRQLEENGFTNGFSTRLGGVSDFPKDSLNLAGYDEDAAANIAENRRRFLAALGGDWILASCWQVHSDEIRVIKSVADAADSDQKMDALVSDIPGVLLAAKTADCVPVLIGDPKTKSFAAIHAGWRGTVNSIVPKAIARLTENFGAASHNLVAAIGPAAGCENYEIGTDVIDEFARKLPGSEHLFRTTKPGHALIDLHRANFEQLTSVGLNPANITVAPFCTMERTDLFFSYRREKKIYGKTGRLMSVIGIAK